MKWKRRDIGSGDVIEVVTDVDKDNMVTIKMPFKAYKRLVNWASVGRTIDAVANSCSDMDAVGELYDLKDALCACHDACRKNHLNENKNHLQEMQKEVQS